jgi:predicted lipoprotein with Yx(FWY)xxD motif
MTGRSLLFWNSTTLLEEIMFVRRMVHGRSILALLVVVAACSKRDKAADTPVAAVVVPGPGAPAVAVAAPPDVPVELDIAAPAGQPVALVDGSGRAVYIIDGGCTSPDCLAQFTPVPGTATAKAGGKATASMAGGTTAADGSKQATYNGQPLYYYRGDSAAGSAKGNGVKVGSAQAHLVGADGKAAAGGRK